MTYVYEFVALSVAVAVAGVVAMRASGQLRDSEAAAEWLRLTAPWAPPRHELTCVVGAHRCDDTAVDTGHIARHHELDVWTLRRVLLEPTAEFVAIVATSYSTAEREALVVPANYTPGGWRCYSCLIGLDGEKPHKSCHGCSCHCGDSQGAQIIPIGRAPKGVAA